MYCRLTSGPFGNSLLLTFCGSGAPFPRSPAKTSAQPIKRPLANCKSSEQNSRSRSTKTVYFLACSRRAPVVRRSVSVGRHRFDLNADRSSNHRDEKRTPVSRGRTGQERIENILETMDNALIAVTDTAPLLCLIRLPANDGPRPDRGQRQISKHAPVQARGPYRGHTPGFPASSSGRDDCASPSGKLTPAIYSTSTMRDRSG